MELKDFEEFLHRYMLKQNNISIEIFDGFSASEMDTILYRSFEPESPIKMQMLSDTDYQKIPMLNQIKYLLNIIEQKGELKLTTKGFLPPKIVAEIYSQGFIKDELVEEGIAKVYKEEDLMSVNLTRILTEISGLTKKRNGKLSLTKNAVAIKSDNYKLLRLIFITFADKFNWAYYDGYESKIAGQIGFAFSLILLSKYGDQLRSDKFYSNKYYKAFPNLIKEFDINNRNADDLARCYSTRTFNRFLHYFGLVEIKEEGKWYERIKHVKKTDTFDKLFKTNANSKREFEQN